LAKLQEAKQLLELMEIVQRKEVVLKTILGPWTDEAYIISTNIQEKLASRQSTQQKIKEDIVVLAIEQLVEQIKQEATQSAVEVAMAQVELAGLCSKIFVLAK